MKIRYLDIDEINDRLAELEDLERTLHDAREELAEAEDDELNEAQEAVDDAAGDFKKPEEQELEKLRGLRDDIGESRGKISKDNGPFIHENDFEDYARELADDIGAIPTNAGWPCTCIDWEKAANELQMDYTSIDWEGVTYYYRA